MSIPFREYTQEGICREVYVDRPVKIESQAQAIINEGYYFVIVHVSWREILLAIRSKHGGGAYKTFDCAKRTTAEFLEEIDHLVCNFLQKASNISMRHKMGNRHERHH